MQDNNEIENPLRKLVDNIVDKNYTSASTSFENILGDKLSSTLDARKVSIGTEMFNDTQEADHEEV